MLIIGSVAANHHGVLTREPKDFDAIITFEELQTKLNWAKDNCEVKVSYPLGSNKWYAFIDGVHHEYEIAWPSSTGRDLLEHFDAVTGDKYATPSTLLALKLSHRYLKNSPHFLKTMRDIQSLRSLGVSIEGTWLGEVWLPEREKATYVYSHPKLKVSKEEFFSGDGIDYIYDHDSIHLTQALMSRDSAPLPAYTLYMADGEQVQTSKTSWDECPHKVKLYGVYEESCVLALERSQIPNNFTSSISPRKSFEIALMKVCTSITSGWFREWAWEHYDEVIALYESLGEGDYINRFSDNCHMLKPYGGSVYA